MLTKEKKKHLLRIDKKRNIVLCFGRKKKMLLSRHLPQKHVCLFVFKNKTGNPAKIYTCQKLWGRTFCDREKKTSAQLNCRQRIFIEAFHWQLINFLMRSCWELLKNKEKVTLTNDGSSFAFMQHTKGFTKLVEKFSRDFKILFGYLNKFKSFHNFKQTV